MLDHVLRGRAKRQQIGVKDWHLRGNMVEEEGLQQMRAVDLDIDLLKEVANVQFLLTDLILRQREFHFDIFVKREGLNRRDG